MKKKIIIICAVFLVITLLGVLTYKKGIKFSEENYELKSYVRNTTWETSFQDKVPYRKGDNLEYFYFFKNLSGNGYDLDLFFNDLKSKINIESIFVNGKETKDGKIKVAPGQVFSINVSGKAITDSSLEQDDKKIEDIKITEDKTVKQEPKKEEAKKIGTNIISKEDVSIPITHFDSNINNFFELDCENGIDSVKSIMIGGVSFKPSIKDNKLFVSIDKNIFDNGSYFIALVLTNGELLSLDESVTFTFNKEKINIVSIIPGSVKNDIPRYITVQGNGFKGVVSVQLSNNVILKNTDFSVINDNVMAIKIPKDLIEGNYHLNIMDVNHVYEIQNKNFLVIK
ncbi:MAG: hypothetical protein PHF46_03370 [Candidatus Gracilibacteria bacterium]|nr:hypothetical protein [Candidatus Gracilibacteria bacterium]